MEAMESVAVKGLATEMKNKCPFVESDEGADDDDDEGIEDDDRDSVQTEQANDGGKLGTNLLSGSPGAGGTVGGPFKPGKLPGKGYNFIQAPGDTARSPENWYVTVPEAMQDDGRKKIEEDDYPFTTAAHHLIPGNAALGQSAIYDYLGPPGTGKLKNDGAARKVAAVVAKNTKKQKTVEFKKRIGYNINGSHNGVWLAGNYAIRSYKPASGRRKAQANTSPVGGAKGGTSWGDDITNYEAWKLHYVAACCKASGGQFHDTHVKYSGRVLKLLDKIATLLGDHILSECEDCEPKKKLPPPFKIKMRLYAISSKLRAQLLAGYTRWKDPWLSSDSWSAEIFGSKKTFEKFKKAWTKAGKARG